MREKLRSHRDFIQNITITLLSLLAVVLSVQPRLFTFLELQAVPATIDLTVSHTHSSFSAPVRVAVSGAYGRYGSITMATTSASFSPLGSLLAQVLQDGTAYTTTTETALLSALSRPSVYYDFLSDLPLSVLGGFVEAELNDTRSVRQLLLAENSSSVTLYLRDSSQRVFSCTTSLSPSELDAVIEQYEQGDAFFALDEGEAAEAIHPLSLFLQKQELFILDSSDSSVSSVQTLSALGFNPYTKTRWQENNAEVIVDEERTLRLYENGSLFYQSGESTALQIASAAETPSLWETASEVCSLLNNLLSEDSCAQLYLRSISGSSSATVLTYDYQYEGIPIRFSDGSTAAEVTLSGKTVTSVALTPRCYTVSEEAALLLPLRQTIAIAAETPGQELLICYTDHQKEQTAPQWLCE